MDNSDMKGLVEKLSVVHIEEQQPAKPDIETMPDTETEPKPRNPIEPDPGLKPKPKAMGRDAELFLKARGVAESKIREAEDVFKPMDAETKAQIEEENPPLPSREDMLDLLVDNEFDAISQMKDRELREYVRYNFLEGSEGIKDYSDDQIKQLFLETYQDQY